MNRLSHDDRAENVAGTYCTCLASWHPLTFSYWEDIASSTFYKKSTSKCDGDRQKLTLGSSINGVEPRNNDMTSVFFRWLLDSGESQQRANGFWLFLCRSCFCYVLYVFSILCTVFFIGSHSRAYKYKIDRCQLYFLFLNVTFYGIGKKKQRVMLWGNC